MTDSIPLDALPGSADDDTRRDGYGRYLIVPPAGGKPIGYTRATTIAKVLDSGGGLAAWKAAMTVQGLLLRPGLRAQWEALMSRESGDPWYHSVEGKASAKGLVEECAAVGGAGDRAQIGLALHDITARIDMGESPSHLPPETVRDLLAYTSGLKSAGIEIMPKMVELTVVLDEHRVAGTFDRLVKVPGRPLPVIADLKTGASLDYSWQSFAVQLAIYSRADSVYYQGKAADGSQDVRVPLGRVDQDFGIILHLNAGSGELNVFSVDLNAGWEAFTHSMWTKRWRNARPFTEGLPPTTDLTPALEESIRARADAAAGITRSGVSQSHNDRRTQWLQARIDTVGAHAAARADLVAQWPTGVPPLKTGGTFNATQLDAVDALLWAIEGRHKLTFPPPSPDDVESREIARIHELFPGAVEEPPPGA